ncbi:MAG: hypothetical protein Q9191_006148 [Dirinaria sp. TL-2023a]
MGRPRKRRQREGDDVNIVDSSNNTGYTMPVTEASSASTQVPDMAPFRYPSEGFSFDNVPLNDLGDLNNGPLAGSILQYPNGVLGSEGPGSFLVDGHSGHGASASSSGATVPMNDPQLMPLPAQILSTESSPAYNDQREQTVSTSGCSCLSNLYATLSSFQSLPPPSFPYSMSILHKATNVARGACCCENCPTQYASALQNLMLLSTLLPLISHGYANLLSHLDERASRTESVTMRLGEHDKTLDDVLKHTGTIDCPMSFDVDLTAEEWRSVARKAIRRKVIGNAVTDTTLLGVVNSLENRQRSWHEHPILAEFQHGKSCREHGSEVGEEHTCLKMLARVRVSIEALDLD